MGAGRRAAPHGQFWGPNGTRVLLPPGTRAGGRPESSLGSAGRAWLSPQLTCVSPGKGAGFLTQGLSAVPAGSAAKGAFEVLSENP